MKFDLIQYNMLWYIVLDYTIWLVRFTLQHSHSSQVLLFGDVFFWLLICFFMLHCCLCCTARTAAAALPDRSTDFLNFFFLAKGESWWISVRHCTVVICFVDLCSWLWFRLHQRNWTDWTEAKSAKLFDFCDQLSTAPSVWRGVRGSFCKFQGSHKAGASKDCKDFVRHGS